MASGHFLLASGKPNGSVILYKFIYSLNLVMKRKTEQNLIKESWLYEQ